MTFPVPPPRRIRPAVRIENAGGHVPIHESELYRMVNHLATGEDAIKDWGLSLAPRTARNASDWRSNPTAVRQRQSQREQMS